MAAPATSLDRAEDSTRPPRSRSQHLAAFANALTFAALPDSVVAGVKHLLLDTLGVALQGSTAPNAVHARAGIGHLDGAPGTCTVWGTSLRLSAPYAAMANGVATHVLDFDDTHTDSITHGSAVLVPVVLALGERIDATGQDTIAALVAGWEVVARVGLASRGTFHQRGFHTTSVAGVFGAATAAARLLRLTEEQASHALGLAGSQVCGVSEYLSNSSSSKSFHPGWAAMSGIIAATLAQAGMTGPMTVFEGRYGTFRTYGVPEECNLDLLDADLGSRWEVARVSIKPYPCCHFAHAFIDCVLAMRRQGVRADAVEALACVVPAIEVPLICEPAAQKGHPDSPYAAKFSLPFLLAAALIDGEIDHHTFATANIARGDLLALAARVSYRVAEPGEMTFPRYFPGQVTATLRSGRIVSERRDINRGNPDHPLAPAEIVAKFRTNAQGRLAEPAVQGIVETVLHLEARSVRDLTQALGAP